jgi:hypothetical protein
LPTGPSAQSNEPKGPGSHASRHRIKTLGTTAFRRIL